MTKKSANLNFYNKTDLTKYENEWVAIVDGKVIAHGKKSDKVYEQARKKEPQREIGLAKLPKSQTLII